MSDIAAAECAIRQLQARYIDAVWRRDVAAFLDCFVEDGEWKIAGLHMRGRAEIAAQFEKFMAPSERILMMLGTPVLEVGQGTAIGRTPATELVKLIGRPAVRTIGVYHELFARQADRWRFQWRHWSLFYYGPLDLAGQFYDSPEYGPPPGMPGAEEPTLARGGG
jgi:uncharacterized protein (TIGR02246 family)